MARHIVEVPQDAYASLMLILSGDRTEMHTVQTGPTMLPFVQVWLILLESFYSYQGSIDPDNKAHSFEADVIAQVMKTLGRKRIESALAMLGAASSVEDINNEGGFNGPVS